MEDCIGVNNGGAFAVFEWLREYEVAIIVVQNHQIVFAGTGRRNEAASLVGIYLSSRLCNGAVALIGFGGVGSGSIVVVVDRLERTLSGFRRPVVFACLVQVAFGHWNGSRRKQLE